MRPLQWLLSVCFLIPIVIINGLAFLPSSVTDHCTVVFAGGNGTFADFAMGDMMKYEFSEYGFYQLVSKFWKEHAALSLYSQGSPHGDVYIGLRGLHIIRSIG